MSNFQTTHDKSSLCELYELNIIMMKNNNEEKLHIKNLKYSRDAMFQN